MCGLAGLLIMVYLSDSLIMAWVMLRLARLYEVSILVCDVRVRNVRGRFSGCIGAYILVRLYLSVSWVLRLLSMLLLLSAIIKLKLW